MDFPTLEQLRVSQCFKCKIANTHLWFKEGFAHTVCYDEWVVNRFKGGILNLMIYKTAIVKRNFFLTWELNGPVRGLWKAIRLVWTLYTRSENYYDAWWQHELIRQYRIESGDGQAFARDLNTPRPLPVLREKI